MTPQLATHLTEDQFGELLSNSTEISNSPSAPAEAHVLTCEQCAAELASLRESLSLFRQASNAYADNELRRMPPISLPTRRSPALEPAYWAAAGALVLAAFLPMQMMHRQSLQATPAVAVADRPAQTDEALLEDVNQAISASVPTPMQSLADPTADVASVDIDSSVPTSTQRKD
jgi:anti-sigma factor RsiW